MWVIHARVCVFLCTSDITHASNGGMGITHASNGGMGITHASNGGMGITHASNGGMGGMGVQLAGARCRNGANPRASAYCRGTVQEWDARPACAGAAASRSQINNIAPLFFKKYDVAKNTSRIQHT